MLSRYRSQLLLTMSCRGGVSPTTNLSSISMRIGELMEEKQPKENVIIQVLNLLTCQTTIVILNF
jgi:hypothetical protein